MLNQSIILLIAQIHILVKKVYLLLFFNLSLLTIL